MPGRHLIYLHTGFVESKIIIVNCQISISIILIHQLSYFTPTN